MKQLIFILILGVASTFTLTAIDHCTNVTCDAGKVCNPQNGLCEAIDLCANVNCIPEEVCNPQNGLCEAIDPCANVTCDAGKICNPQNGLCEVIDLCANVNCIPGKICNPQNGLCEAIDHCANVTCNAGEICNPQTGLCESIDLCFNINCSDHGVCDLNDENIPTCNCNDGYHAIDLTCIQNNFTSGDIIITEIMANPDTASDEVAEWLEIYNSSDHTIDLVDLIIVRSKSEVYNSEVTFLNNSTEIASHEYLLIARTDQANLENIDATSNFALGNSGETQLELNLYGVILDSVIYKEENVEKGKSWQLDPNYLNSTANDNSLLWCLSSTSISNNNNDLGTPRLVNLSCNLNICENISCSNHGTCFDNNGTPSCNCEVGYHPEELECIIDPTCDGITCSDHGNCNISDYTLSCVCNAGYHAVGLECIEDVTSCDNVTCSDHGTCQLEDSMATCVCDQDYHAIDLECISDDPCTDVTCSDHGVCDNSTGEAICNCEEGFKRENLTCIPETVLLNDIIITEIMANPHINDPNNGGVPDDRTEWLELYNNSDNSIDLSGLKVLKGITSYDVTFVGDTTLDSHQYLLIARTVDLSRLTDVKATSNFEFKNDASAIAIKLRNTVLDSITYDYPSKGKSWQLDPQSFTNIENDNNNNWCLGSVVISNENHDLGTPGLENVSCRDLCAGNTCKSWEDCNSTDGSCELKDGMCATDLDCTDVENPICNLETHLCIEEVIECNPTCNDWETCNIGTCELKDGRCNTIVDCTGDEICDENNSCVNVDNPCDGVTCSDHGMCEEVEGLATCNCDTDYSADGLNCIKDVTDLCKDVTCDSWMDCNPTDGSCELKDGMCDSDSDCTDKTCDENHNCVDTVNICDGVTCNEHGTCEEVDGDATCNCEVGYRADGIKCIEESEKYKGDSMIGCTYSNQSGTNPFIIFLILSIFIFILRRKEE